MTETTSEPEAVRNLARPATELDHLLAHGPFADALRAAIRACGLSQERVLDRLRRHGASISPATLSYWQSGRSRPERPASLAALRCLESVLGLPDGGLSQLLEPPRPRGRRTQASAGTAMDVLWPYQDAMWRTLEKVDMRWSASVIRISLHDQVEIGADGGEIGLRIREVLCATEDGPDRCVTFHHIDEPGCPLPQVRALRGCRIGATHAEPETGLNAVELLFPQPLSRGEAVLIEYYLANVRPFPRDGYYERTFRWPLREYVLEAQFTAPALPVSCVQYWASESGASQLGDQRRLGVDEAHRATLVALDVAPGRRGIRWEFG